MADHTFGFVGGNLCLDFANTTGWRGADKRSEHLCQYADLVAWGRQAGILTAEQAGRLSAEAGCRPDEAAVVLAKAIALRETVFRIFAALGEQLPAGLGEAGAAGGRLPASLGGAEARGAAATRTVAPADLAALNAGLTRAMAHARIADSGDGFVWDWDPDPTALDRMLWPVARAAADLLTAAPRPTIRMCEGPACGWLFVDTTKNRRRRWCSMEDCGNRAKARRFYERKKQASP